MTRTVAGATRTFLFAGGGTGGHVYPLLAVAAGVRELDADLRIIFVGTDRGIEREAVPRRGFELELMQVKPLRGVGVSGAVRGIAAAFAALPAGYALLNRVKPAAVLTVGGYAAGPISLAARTLGIPLALLEPNAVMGFANRAMAPWVDRAYTAFPAVERHFAGAKVYRSGVPIREGFAAAPWCRRSGALRILVLGGSQGARTLNENVPPALAVYGPRISICHQCGKTDLELVRARYTEVGLPEAEVLSFIDDMPQALRAADLVISRSGASAVSEICAVGRASILVPYPFAAGNHQQLNAESVAQAGAACWIPNREATVSRLSGLVGSFIDGTHSIEEMSVRARTLGRPEAALHIARDLLTLSGLGCSTMEERKCDGRMHAEGATTIGASKELN